MKPGHNTFMLSVRLFGSPHFAYGGEVLRVRGKTRLLLAYLAHLGRETARSELMRLFWPSGRPHNLRQALGSLRRLPGAGEWLWDQGSGVHVKAKIDTAEFEGLVNTLSKQPLGSADHSAALALATAPFLPLDATELPDLEAWQQDERRRLSELLQRARRAQAAYCAQAGKVEDAELYLKALLNDDPSDEDAAQRLMSLYVQSGRRDQASAVYNALKRELKSLGSELHPRTTALLGTEQDYAELLAQARRLLPPELSPGSAALWSKVVGLPELEVAQWLSGAEHNSTELEAVPPLSPPLATLWQGRLAHWLSELNERPVGTPLHTFWALIAQHWQAAGRCDQAAQSLTRAAQQAQRIGAYAAARQHYTQALSLLDDEARLPLLSELAGLQELLADAPGLEQNAQALHAYAQRWQSDAALLTAHLSTATAKLLRGELSQADLSINAALGVVERLERANITVDLNLRCRLHLLRGNLRLRAGRYAEARAAYQAGLACQPPPELKVRFLGNLGAVYGQEERLVEARHTLEDALSLARSLGQLPSALGIVLNLAVTAEKLGDTTAAISGNQETLSLARELNHIPSLHMAYRNLATLHLRRGALGLAWNTAQDLQDLPIPDAAHAALPDLVLAEVEWHCGALGAARQRLEARLATVPAGQLDRIGQQVALHLGILSILQYQDQQPLLALLAQAEAASYQELLVEGRLDAALFLTAPEQIRRHLEALSQFNTSGQLARTPNRLARLELIRCQLAWREQRPVKRSVLRRLAREPFLYALHAARLLNRLEGSTQTWQLYLKAAARAGQGLPPTLRRALVKQLSPEK
ncbi:tetratricopeptide repeat protein [Deinococcus detaillensis]|uniref:Tetratricopeptide repeat protein n=1 Tax=Deinococcus detaillensis TaxID=2592048 RepID=A0A553UW54_9DEIO|nr:BTAD domain-containing putative transcriptional regulator [Deinococcus detaillensis]TSA84447.1 tetratricopeptide repeat protein [Deinococcus detaillensis]